MRDHAAFLQHRLVEHMPVHIFHVGQRERSGIQLLCRCLLALLQKVPDPCIDIHDVARGHVAAGAAPVLVKQILRRLAAHRPEVCPLRQPFGTGHKLCNHLTGICRFFLYV